MCNCNNIAPGSHKNEVVINVPNHIELSYNAPGANKRETVCIDKCLVEEIKTLWNKGVITEACCCGHNVQGIAHIIVNNRSINKMISMGYNRWTNPMDHTRRDGFKPKSIN